MWCREIFSYVIYKPLMSWGYNRRDKVAYTTISNSDVGRWIKVHVL